MKRYKTLFIKYPDSFQFLVFNILFYLSMSLSRSVHSIWFDLNGSLLNYSISYSAMAFSGMFAGILGRRINYFNLRNLIRIGVILYSIGLLLRLFPNDWLISLISGLISGIGAATIILLLRTWAVGIGRKRQSSYDFLKKIFQQFRNFYWRDIVRHFAILLNIFFS
ncbi:transporter%2C major facilitator family [Streptococcus pneumoniae]|uniref:hypothetical protein n=1 Tax=Streptococcus pneumoniae TaxID=1313 RepID=UPI0005E67E55|nr:hypothetical protein [Streptococcus pneumoniae]CMU78066.1 transporter%2C major facilitator family [Streptococcus pneumoniae]